MRTKTLTLATLLVVGLAGGQATQETLVRVSPASLRILAKGNGNDQDAAEALAYDTRPNELRHLAGTPAAERADLLARAGRQLAPETAKGFGPSARITVKDKPASRTPLANGAVLYDFTFGSALLVPVKLQTEIDEATMMKSIAKVVFKHVRVPVSAQNPVTGQLIQERTSTGEALWRGSLTFGLTPNANGVYSITDPKWYDSASVWADGQFVWVQFRRDDMIGGRRQRQPKRPDPQRGRRIGLRVLGHGEERLPNDLAA